MKDPGRNRSSAKLLNRAVVFVSNSNAQTEDALRGASKLRPDLHVCLISLDPSAISSSMLKELHQNSRIKIVNITTKLPMAINQFCQILALRWILARYFRKFDQFVLVLGDDICPVERSAIALARKWDVPTLLIIDGILDESEADERIFTSNRKQDFVRRLARRVLHTTRLLPPLTPYGSAGCDRVAVWGGYLWDLMLKRGVPVERLEMTGSPRFDKYLNMTLARPTSAANAVRRVLFADFLLSAWGMAPYEVDCQVLTVLERIAEANPNWEIIVRPHPTDSLEVYHQIFQASCLTRLKLDRETPVDQSLAECDVLIIYNSTMAMEGMMLGKPAICLVVAPNIAQSNYVREGAVLSVNNLDRLGNAIWQALEDPITKEQMAEASRRFISRYMGYNDGHSSERVARLIESLLGETGSMGKT